MEQELVARGLKPKLMKLDNEASKLLKMYLHQQNITFQLVPPYIHIRFEHELAVPVFCHHFLPVNLINYSHSRNPPCAPARTHGRIQAPREPPN
jgi:hypothetical protein